MLTIGSTEDKDHNPIIHFSWIISLYFFHKRLFSLSCLGVQVVLDYKFCLFLTIAIWGAFFASSDFLVLVLVRTRWLSRQFENGVTSIQLSMTYVAALRSLIVLGGPLNSCGSNYKDVLNCSDNIVICFSFNYMSECGRCTLKSSKEN